MKIRGLVTYDMFRLLVKYSSNEYRAGTLVCLMAMLMIILMQMAVTTYSTSLPSSERYKNGYKLTTQLMIV